MCEHHFLSENRSVEIFKGYFERLKKYGEYISYQAWEKTIEFSNVRETILYLFEEAKKERILSSHLSNAITLLQFADMNALSVTEQDEIFEYGLQLIQTYRTNIEIQQHLMFHIPNNPHFRTSARIAQLHSVIKDCENPELLNEFFRLVKEADLSDDYIDWIISKRECIRNYDVRGTIHMVRKEPLIDIFTSVSQADSIIKALGQCDYVTGVHFDGDKRSEIISLIFDNLHAVPPTDITEKHISDLLTLLGSEHLSNYFRVGTSDVVLTGYKRFFFDRNYDEPIFSRYYSALKKEALSPSLSNPDQIDFFHSHMNVLSSLITEERFDLMMNDNDLSEEQRFWWIANRLGQYENISSHCEWNDRIMELRTKYQPPFIDHTKKAQDGFDILFDYKKFMGKIHSIAKKHEVLFSDWEERVKLWREDLIEETVTHFIGQYGEKDNEKNISMSEVVEKAFDPTIFNDFLFTQLDNYLRQNVSVSEEQQAQIENWVREWVDGVDNSTDHHSLGHLIDVYNVKLSDKQLLSLMPYSCVAIKTSTPPALFDDTVDHSLLRHIHDNISDKKLIAAEIDRVLSSSDYDWPPLFEKFTAYIVHNRITGLYKHFEKMMFGKIDAGWRGGYYSDYPVRIATTILKLGQEGARILDSLKGHFNDGERLYYYRRILTDDKLKPNKLPEIVTDLHGIYVRMTSNHNKEVVIFLLTGLGDVDGLKITKDYYFADSSSFCSGHPNFSQYGDEHIDTIKQIYEFSHIHDKRERSNMRDGVFNWLNAYAMRSEKRRDTIIDYYTKLSEDSPDTYPHLMRVAKNLRNKYYEENSPAMQINESVRLYESISVMYQ